MSGERSRRKKGKAVAASSDCVVRGIVGRFPAIELLLAKVALGQVDGLLAAKVHKARLCQLQQKGQAGDWGKGHSTSVRFDSMYIRSGEDTSAFFGMMQCVW